MQQLLEIMQKLRDPENGCPWDVEQEFLYHCTVYH